MLFKQVYEQERSKEVIRNAVRNNRLSHALLLLGKEGIGKLPLCLAIAQYINCENPSQNDACGICSACVKINQVVHPDIHFIFPIISKTTAGQSLICEDFIDSFREKLTINPYFTLSDWTETLDEEKNKQTAISISEIRNLKSKIEYKAFEARYKVVIIWHAEKIRTEAANAFLKLLEEPPSNTIILLTTENTSNILPTILSRCQTLKLKGLSNELLIKHLIQNQVDAKVAEECANLSEGSLSLALELSQQSNHSLTLAFMEWMRLCLKPNTMIQQFIEWTERMAGYTKEYQKIYFEFAIQKLRNALMYYAQTPELSNSTKMDHDFLAKFSSVLNLVVIEKINEVLEQTIFYLSRNANTNLTLLNTCLNIQSIFMKFKSS